MMNLMKRANSNVNGIPSSFARARILADDRVQQHDAVVGQHAVGHLEEVRVALVAEMLEGADGHDSVDRLVELLPTL